MNKLYCLLALALIACNTPDAGQKMMNSSQPQSTDVQNYPAQPDPTASYSATGSNVKVSPYTSAVIAR